MGDSTLALLGGPKAVQSAAEDMFVWPIITSEDEQAVLEVLRRGGMSGTEVTAEFEKEFADWHGSTHAVAFSSGTAALQSAMWACGVRRGDEVIGPSLTYWASVMPAYSLGASIVFAEVDPETLCLDPNDLEHRITERTKAIVPVHYCGYPCDMDAIMAIARKHGIKVIEDVSHAHGGLYKGRLVGTIGDVGAMSCMSGKSFAIGEGGALVTNDPLIYQRAVAWGHYERTSTVCEDPELKPFNGLPWGGYKYRMHQLSSAVGRVQLRHYRARMEEIQKAMNYFWDLLEGVPGIRAHRPAKGSGSTMGGWYASHGLYVPEELGGLHVARFCEAVRAEGASTSAGANFPLHTHKLFHDADIYGDGQPTAIANANRDLRQPAGSLPVTEAMPSRCYGIPWFKHYRPAIIEEYALAFRKAAEHADELLAHFGEQASDAGGAVLGSSGLFARR
ncbi:MAG: DegT/DnrJ/EryC1/StrS family aminotransferase [Armatimonadetes bacterium]|nr:DegT/DnrJ/EryC1/StrS family aminotransferase [Armatimonadota bacterium]